MEEPVWPPVTAGAEMATEELGARWRNWQRLLKLSTSTHALGHSLQVPVRLPGTCGGTLPTAASPLHALSGALQQGTRAECHWCVDTRDSKPHLSATVQWSSEAAPPWLHKKPEGTSREWAEGLQELLSWHAPCRVSVCSLLRASNCSCSCRSLPFSTWEAGK